MPSKATATLKDMTLSHTYLPLLWSVILKCATQDRILDGIRIVSQVIHNASAYTFCQKGYTCSLNIEYNNIIIQGDTFSSEE